MTPVARQALAYSGAGLIGVLVGVVAPATHRFGPFEVLGLPFAVGVIGAGLLTAAAAVFVRAWRGLAGVGAFAFGWYAALMVFASPVLLAVLGPGDSAFVVADALGYEMLAGTFAALVAVTVAPRRWFEDAPPASDKVEPVPGDRMESLDQPLRKEEQ